MNFQRQSRISQEKRWKIMGMVWNIIQTIQKKANQFGYTSPASSFYKKYRNTSLAILNNFSSKMEAIQASKQYEVPLLYITVANSKQQQFVWKYLLNCFQNSQILNQGFIFWVQFHPNYPPQNSDQQHQMQKNIQGTIDCYHDELIYKKMKISELPGNEQQIYEILDKIRTQYYHLNDQVSNSSNSKHNQPNGKNIFKQEKKELNDRDIRNEMRKDKQMHKNLQIFSQEQKRVRKYCNENWSQSESERQNERQKHQIDKIIEIKQKVQNILDGELNIRKVDSQPDNSDNSDKQKKKQKQKQLSKQQDKHNEQEIQHKKKI